MKAHPKYSVPADVCLRHLNPTEESADSRRRLPNAHSVHQDAIYGSLNLILLLLWLLAAGVADAATRTVTSLADSGNGTLREAIQISLSGDVITFESALSGVITLNSSLPVLSVDLTIITTNVGSVTLNGNNTYQILVIASARTVAISGLAIVRGGGNAIDNSGTLTFTDCTIGNCSATFPIFNRSVLGFRRCRLAGNSAVPYLPGQVSFNECTISDNTVSGSGFINNLGTMGITNSTLSRNLASSGNGGAIYNAGTLTLSSCTVCSNVCSTGSGGGIYRSVGTIQMQNTIVAGNSASGSGRDVFGAVASQGFNLVGTTDGSSGWVASDLTGSVATPLDPVIGPLRGNGSSQFTHALLPGSPAIDAGLGSGLTTDEREAPRPYDDPSVANRPGSDGSDIGAFESGLELPPTTNVLITRVVTTLNDSGPGSLREAMMVSVSGDAITFTPGLAGTISLASNLPSIRGDLTITGDSNQSIMINGNTNKIFVSGGPCVVAISGLSLVRAGGTLAGAIENNGSTVLVENCTVSNCVGNLCLFNLGTVRIKGSRIVNNKAPLYTQGLMTFNNSTISDNVSATGGFLGNVGTMAITNSTLSRNSTSSGNGGAINNSGTLILTSSTVCSNVCSAGSGGGMYRSVGTIQLQNTIVAGNSASGQGRDIFGAVTSQGYNLIGVADGSSGWIASDLTGSVASPLSPLLGPLQDNGGSTFTHALLTGSPAIDAGKSFGVATDQRGSVRPSDDLSVTNVAGGDGSDIGAFEIAAPPPAPPKLTIVPGGPGLITISWAPAVPRYELQESPGLSPANWSSALSGSTNPITAPSGLGNRYFRLIKACGPGSERLDQQQPTQNAQAGSQDQWQSFTAGKSGLLTRIEWSVGSPTSPAPSPGVIRVYGGEGIAGPLLATESVTFNDPIRFQAFTFSAPPQVTAGSHYTIRFSAPSVSGVWVAFTTADSYAGGRADLDPSLDYAFKTFVEPVCE